MPVTGVRRATIITLLARYSPPLSKMLLRRYLRHAMPPFFFCCAADYATPPMPVDIAIYFAPYAASLRQRVYYAFAAADAAIFITLPLPPVFICRHMTPAMSRATR